MDQTTAFIEVGREKGYKMTVAEIKAAISALRDEKSREGQAYRFGLQEALTEMISVAA